MTEKIEEKEISQNDVDEFNKRCTYHQRKKQIYMVLHKNKSTTRSKSK